MVLCHWGLVKNIFENRVTIYEIRSFRRRSSTFRAFYVIDCDSFLNTERMEIKIGVYIAAVVFVQPTIDRSHKIVLNLIELYIYIYCS